MQEISIYIYNTYFKVFSEKNGFLILGELNVDRFLWTLTESQWNPRTYRWVSIHKYCYYDKKSSMLHFPRYVLDDFLEYIKKYQYRTVYFPAPDGKEISVRLQKGIEDKPNQIDLIEYLTDMTVPIKMLEASTGIGKTYCAIRSTLVSIGEVSLIQTSGLVDQWKAEILKFTNIKEKDIYKIQGANSLLKLFKKKKIKPKVFIASTKTLHSYVLADKYPYSVMMSYEEFLYTYGISQRVIDEVHLNFFANTIIDLKSHVKNTINLSATYGRSSNQGNKIFNKIYPEILRFGSHHASKYTRVLMYSYSLLNGYMQKVKLIGANGYMQCKYELAICKHRATYEEFMERVLKPLIYSHFVNYRKDGERLLILAFTRGMVEAIHKEVERWFPQYRSITFLGEDDDEKYKDCDIIVSTMKSSGTGRDIKRLITTINTTSFKAETLTRQCMGRLRHIADRETIFVDMFNRDIGSHCEHQRIRKGIYQTRALSYYETQIN